MPRPAEQLVLPPPRTYTRTDFAALRAYVQPVPPLTIARLYLDPDAPHTASSEHIERYLKQMRDDLVQLALLHGSPVLASHLKQSTRQHGSAKLTAVTLRMVEQASTLAAAAPAAAHPVGLWFRPLVAQRLTGEGIATLGELVATCNRRGGSWWRSVPRIGRLRARTIVAWLRRHARTLGVTVDADVDATDPLVAPAATHVMIGDGQGGALAPLERIELPHVLSGAQGANRAPGLCYLRAHHDLEAIRSYLHRYRDRPQALRAYTRELERLLLWAVTERGRPLSSLDVDDCEAYKAFLAAPGARFTGPRTARSAPRWRPFAPDGLSADSQRYAVAVLRAAFEWLVRVRYLAGNPWAAVTDPATVVREHAMQIERALPVRLWRKVRAALDARAQQSGLVGARWRAARAAILLMGDSGLRITEASLARREQLRWHAADDDVPAGWELQGSARAENSARCPSVRRACRRCVRTGRTRRWHAMRTSMRRPRLPR
jgi:integrase/recombinase XerD